MQYNVPGRLKMLSLAIGIMTTASSCGRAQSEISATLNEAESEDRFETIELLSSELILAPGTTESISIPRGWRHVRRLTINAEGIGRDAMFEIVVNSEIKGTIYVPGRDPAYVVTVAEGARSIELRHTQGARVRISNIEAVVSQASTNPGSVGGPISDASRAESARIAYHSIELCDDFHPYISVSDWETYVLPIKIAAGRTYALARASGDLSVRVRNSLVSLMAQMTLADPFIDRVLQDNSTFNLAVELLAMRNTIEDLLN